jgi:hypothetical protein
MNEWQSVARGAPDIVGLDEGGPGKDDIARVEVSLSVVPPYEWTEYFRSPVGVTVPPDIRPTLARDRLTFALPETRLEGYVAVLDELIAQANERYRTNVLPRLAKQQQDAELRSMATSAHEASSEEKLDALRRRAKEL